MLRVDVYYVVVKGGIPPRLRHLLTHDEQVRASSMTSERSQSQFVVGRALLRTCLAKHLQLMPTQVPIQLTNAGKPWFEHLAGDPLAFSLAHSGDLVALAVAACETLGIDLEAHRVINVQGRLAERVFSAREQALFEKLEESIQADVFFQAWACKEALLKAEGSGFTQPARNFEVLEPHVLAPGVDTAKMASEVQSYRLYPLFVAAGYAGALALPARHQAEIKTRFVALDEIS